jgi:hypothetical protein
LRSPIFSVNKTLVMTIDRMEGGGILAKVS